MTTSQLLARRHVQGWYYYGVAIGLVFAAAALRAALLGALGGRAVFLTFYPAVTLAALYGGPRSGLLAAIVSGVLATFWMEPAGRIVPPDPGDWLSLGVFWAGCAVISWVAGILKRAQQRVYVAETELQLAAERQRGEERFRRVVENISDAVIVDDARGNVVFANDQFLTLYGRSRDELPNLRLEDYVAPEFRAELRDRHERRIRGEAVPIRFEYQGLRKDGRRVWVEVRVVPVHDDAGRITGTQSSIRDITKRKRAEEALRESEQRYRTLFETAPDAIVVHREGEFLYANDAALALTGANSFAELANHTTFEFFRPQDRAQAVERALTAMTGEKLPAREATLLRLDGQEATVEFHTAPLELQGTRAILTIIRDVTKRKQADMRLANDLTALTRMHALSARFLNSEGLQPLLQEIMDTAVAITGAERGTLQLLEGDSLRIVAHRGHQQPFLEFFASAENRASACGAALRSEQRVVVPDVETSSQLAGTASLSVLREAGVRAIQSTPLVSRGGVLLGVLTTQWSVPHSPDEHDLWRIDLLARQAADLIECTSTETALRRQEAQALDQAAKLQAVLDSAPALIWISHDRECRSMTGNRAAFEFSRVPIGQDLSKSGAAAERLVHYRVFENGRDLAPHEMPMQRVAASGQALTDCAIEFHFDDGSVRSLLGNVVPTFDAYGQPDGAIAAFMDVTELRQLQSEREAVLNSERTARTEAERASRMKDEFIAILSHELRNPLNVILGWAHILRRSRRAPQDVERALDVIEKSGRTLTEMITDLLDMSRIVGGKLRLDIQNVDLRPVVAAAVDAVRAAADAKKIKLEITCVEGVGKLRGDPNRLQQIIWNLLANAVKFTAAGGSVKLLACRTDARVEIRVSDTGQGIEPEFLPHVFERFRQEDASMSRKHGGLGLGLSIVRSLVEMHGGIVSVESPGKGQGATFTVSLPVSGAEGEPTSSTAAGGSVALAGATPLLQGIKVLLVDDEPEALEVAKRMLEEHLAQVVTAGSAREGMALLQRICPDVLISDIGMPEEDGLQFMRRVRALHRACGGATPAVALTAYAGLEDCQRALACGYQAHLPKPIDVDQLIATVGGLVGRLASPPAQPAPDAEAPPAA